jgi:D-alanyl-D-alanine dipeptidase
MQLVNVNNFGIKGINYYCLRRNQFNLSEADLKTVGISGNDCLVDETLIPKLQEANRIFKKHGYEIIVKDGYRSPEQYLLVQQKRYANEGQEITDRTFNPIRQPHSTGLTVDLNLIDLNTTQKVEMWDKKDWPDGAFIDFYRNKNDPKSQKYQKLQDLLMDTMLGLGFKIGEKREFWHFEISA